MFNQAPCHDGTRYDCEQHKGGQCDQKGQHVELEETVRFFLVMDQVQTSQQGFETTVCRIATNCQCDGALRGNGSE